MTEVSVSEGEDVHVDVCVSLNGSIDEIEIPFFVEFDLCALGQGRTRAMNVWGSERGV